MVSNRKTARRSPLDWRLECLDRAVFPPWHAHFLNRTCCQRFPPWDSGVILYATDDPWHTGRNVKESKDTVYLSDRVSKAGLFACKYFTKWFRACTEKEIKKREEIWMDEDAQLVVIAWMFSLACCITLNAFVLRYKTHFHHLHFSVKDVFSFATNRSYSNWKAASPDWGVITVRVLFVFSPREGFSDAFIHVLKPKEISYNANPMASFLFKFSTLLQTLRDDCVSQ